MIGRTIEIAARPVLSFETFNSEGMEILVASQHLYSLSLTMTAWDPDLFDLWVSFAVAAGSLLIWYFIFPTTPRSCSPRPKNPRAIPSLSHRVRSYQEYQTCWAGLAGAVQISGVPRSSCQAELT